MPNYAKTRQNNKKYPSHFKYEEYKFKYKNQFIFGKLAAATD